MAVTTEMLSPVTCWTVNSEDRRPPAPGVRVAVIASMNIANGSDVGWGWCSSGHGAGACREHAAGDGCGGQPSTRQHPSIPAADGAQDLGKTGCCCPGPSRARLRRGASRIVRPLPGRAWCEPPRRCGTRARHGLKAVSSPRCCPCVLPCVRGRSAAIKVTSFHTANIFA